MQAVSERLLAEVWKSGPAQPAPNTKAVLCAYAWLADDTSGQGTATAAEVAESAQVSEPTVRRITSALIESGDLATVRTSRGRVGLTYHLARVGGPTYSPCAGLPDHRARVERPTRAPRAGSQTPTLSPRAGCEPDSSRARAVLALDLEEITTKPPRAKKVGRPSFDAEFAEWWECYPRKVARARALVEFTKRRQQGVTIETLTTARDGYCREVAGKDAQYVLHGSTFLGANGRWSDDWNVPEATPKLGWMATP